MENNELNPTLEAVELEFVADCEDGKSPTLTDYIQRYPQFATELTEFVVEFLSIENAVAGLPSSPEEAGKTKAGLPAFLTNLQKPVDDLDEAREAMGWTPSEFAQRLGIPPKLLKLIVRGQIIDAPQQPQLISRLEETLFRPPYQVIDWLKNARMPVPDHFKSTGPPQELISQLKTWQEALLECQKRGELTKEQAAVWLPKKKKR